ncbi:LptF/LptG family permease [Candidatus Kryptobacter tengchongensis]|uniref:LptF/LptG family permease n=1 Tax=Kryptobacter tengchongensis TaxID=1643429 RepID=UPI00070828E7|nr:LptF/LptG family permease [Candidatus Kryptobacter tengchongensis]CUS85353.1 lipopolysaccharide export system permease protein [Candidatus Kryptobacter tengchongensis]
MQGKLKIIDIYVTKQFLQMIIFGLIAFILIFILVDLMENLDDFIDQRVSLSIILKYYLYFSPEIIKLTLPVAVLLSCLFTTGRLSNLNELTAIKVGGMSLYRFMMPFLIVSLLLSLLSVYFNGWVVPKTNKKKLNLERVYMRKHLESWGKYNIYIQDTYTRLLSIGYFDDELNVAHRVDIQDFDQDDVTRITARYIAPAMKWDSLKDRWLLINCIYRKFYSNSELIEKKDTLDIGKLNFKPIDIKRKQMKPDEMNLDEMREFIRDQIRSGNDPSRWLTDYYSKLAFPFSNFIVVLFGVALASQKKRAGLAMEFGLSLLIAFLYFIFMKIAASFGYAGILHPFISAWLANIIFLIGGIVVILKVRK